MEHSVTGAVSHLYNSTGSEMNTHPLGVGEVPVVRGFIPVGLRSGPKICNRAVSDTTGSQVLRLLRSRTGMNPFATEPAPTGFCVEGLNHG